MSDFQKQSQINAAATLTSRRKLIRLGAAAVPVVATLTSQSALATNCITGSAWGSNQVSNSASQAARNNGKSVGVTTGYKISKWNAASNSATALTPQWQAFQSAYPTFKNHGSGSSASFRQGLVTFGQLQGLDSTKFKTPVGFNASDLVVGNLGDNDKSYFAVAQLNYAVGQKPPTQCVTSTDWDKILAGAYPTSGNPWSLSQIAQYLKNNYIVQLS